MVQQSIGGRRREPYYHPRADGPAFSQKAGFLPNHPTNGSGPRIPGGELGSRYPRNFTNHQNHNHKNNFNHRNGNHHGGRNFYPNGNQAAGLPRFPQSRNADENYRLGNNFHGRGTPSGPRAYRGLDQGYNPNYRPGQDRGPQQYLQNQHGPRQTGYQGPGFDGSNQGPSRRRRGGRNRRQKQNQQLPLSLPLPTPVISQYDSIDDIELFDEPIEPSIEPFVPILGSDGMYYDRDGDIIIEDAPEVDIVQIVTEGTIEMAKITQSLLESITKFG